MRPRPSPNSTRARQSRSRRARPASSELCSISPGRACAKRGSKFVRDVRPDRLDDVEDGAPSSRPEVVGAFGVRTLEQAEQPVDDVVDVDVVARLPAAAVHRRGEALNGEAAEDRDNAGLAERILPRSIDVAGSRRYASEPVEACKQPQILFRAELGQAVRRLRHRLHVLRCRQQVGLPVDRAAAGNVDDACVDGSCCFEELIVPSTLVRASNAGSRSERRTSICAARWKITSAAYSCAASASASPSRMSRVLTSTPFALAASRFAVCRLRSRRYQHLVPARAARRRGLNR